MIYFYQRLDFKVSLVLILAIFISVSFASWLYLRDSMIWYQPITDELRQDLVSVNEHVNFNTEPADQRDILAQFQHNMANLKDNYPQYVFVLINSRFTPIADSAPDNFMIELVRPDAEFGLYSVVVSAVWDKADVVTIYVNVPGRQVITFSEESYTLIATPKMKQTPTPLISVNILYRFGQHLLRFGWVYVLMLALAIWVVFVNISPLRRLEKVAKALSDNQIPNPVKESGSNEVGKIISAFNHASCRLAENQQVRERMISDIAHELRTPITNVLGRIEAYEEGIVKDKDAVIQFTSQQLLGLASLVEDMQTLSNADANQLSVITVNIRLVELLQEWAQQYSSDPKVDITVEYPPQLLSIEIPLDRQRMLQIFENLLSNSRRAKPLGLKVVIGAEQINQHVALSFSDNGHGVPTEHLPLLFERLYRVDSSRNVNTGGAGLGLSIVKTLVEAQAGNVSARKGKIGGLCILMEFPIKNKLF